MSKGIPNLGESIRRLRLSRGIEQNELSGRIGITQSHLSKIETGKANPSLRTIRKLAEALAVDEKIFFSTGTSLVSLDEEGIALGHLCPELREFIVKEDSAPFMEFAKNLHENGFTSQELEAFKLIFLSRRRK